MCIGRVIIKKMAGRTRLMKEMQEIKREAARGRAEKDVKLEPDEADIYTWKARIKVWDNSGI